MKPYRIPIIMLLSVGMILMPYTTGVMPKADAVHLSDEITWKVVVVSNYPACSNYHYQIMNKYHEITEKYFGLYEMPNSPQTPSCYSIENYEDKFTPDQELDFLIVVLDTDLGREYMHSQHVGGLYSHIGKDKSTNHAIVMCDCPNFGYSDPVWILTHELSHFILYYKNYDFDVIEDLVHAYDDKYDQCRDSYKPECADIIVKLRVDSMAYSFTVMPPYKDAVDSEPLEPKKEPIPEDMIAINKIITKWWAQGKITDAEYANVVGFVSPYEDGSSDNDYQVMFRDGPVGDGGLLTWDEAIGITNPEKNPDSILKFVPNHDVSEEQKAFARDNASGLPEWFKQSAVWWSEDKISDKEFVDSVQYLEKIGVIRMR